jgi:flagellar biosynthesis regulator FlbT
MSASSVLHPVFANRFDPREQAQRCRRLARTVTDQRTYDALSALAAEYEQEARSRIG